MEEIMSMNFKEKSDYVEGLALEYKKALVALENETGAIYLESLREDVAIYKVSEEKIKVYKNFKRLIDSILSKLDKIDRTILVNDYFFKRDDSWWLNVFSKSSYYRSKKKALNSFFEYFMN